MVSSDINGDGLSNDRAFVFDPTRSHDTTVARGMRELLAQAPASAVVCLARALERAAARNACEGPWTATVNARFGLNAYQVSPKLAGWDVELYLHNPLGGIDQILHGSRLHGWGSTMTPDPILLQTTGFVPTEQRFRYSVNPRFGDVGVAATRVRSPFGVTLAVKANLGAAIGVQQLERFLQPGRAGNPGKKLTAAELNRPGIAGDSNL
jgi:hypothetical protein